jgi:hypothetical protein
MDISFYQMGDLYKKQVLLREFTNSPEMDSKNSYQGTASMMGPGHGPSNAGDGQNAQFGNQIMFPNGDIPNNVKAKLLIEFFRHEIDKGKWKVDTKESFKQLLSHLLGADFSEDDK